MSEDDLDGLYELNDPRLSRAKFSGAFDPTDRKPFGATRAEYEELKARIVAGAAAAAAEPAWKPTLGHPYRLEDLVPLRDRLIVQPLAASARSETGNVILVETGHQRERPQHGLVLAVGAGIFSRGGDSRLPMQAKVGDLVFYGKYSGQEFVIAGTRVLNMGEGEVFSVLPAGRFHVIIHDDVKDSHLEGDYCELCATPAEKEAKSNLLMERERLLAQQRIAADLAALEG